MTATIKKLHQGLDNVDFIGTRFGTTLIENTSSPKTTLRENETTLFENRPNTSGLDHINENS